MFSTWLFDSTLPTFWLFKQHTNQYWYWTCILDLLQMAALHAIHHGRFESGECKCPSLHFQKLPYGRFTSRVTPYTKSALCHILDSLRNKINTPHMMWFLEWYKLCKFPRLTNGILMTIQRYFGDNRIKIQPLLKNSQLCTDVGCCLKDLPRELADRCWESRESILLTCFDDETDHKKIRLFTLLSFFLFPKNWKVHGLTKILSWNVNHLFFNIVPLAIYTLLPLVLQCLNFSGKTVIHSRHDVIFWTFQPTPVFKVKSQTFC